MLIHVGYVKTGSTMLQERLFRDDLGFRSIGGHREVRDKLILPAQIEYDRTDGFEQFSARAGKALDLGLEPVLSHERLSGNPISGGYDAILLRDRLHELFPEAKVLIVVREQRSMALSCYKQYVREGGAGGIAAYLNPPVAGKLPLFSERFLRYDLLVEAYMQRFGTERVKVVPFERLRGDLLGFVNSINTFCRKPALNRFDSEQVNRMSKPLATAIMAQTNRFFYRDNANPTAPFRWDGLSVAIERLAFTPKILSRGLDARWRRRVEELFAGAFSASNRRLQEYVTEDLAEFGYQL